MLAYLRSPAFPALALHALACGVEHPRHSVHPLLMRLCSHICDPLHSLHWLLMHLWGHMLDPRHSMEEVEAWEHESPHAKVSHLAVMFDVISKLADRIHGILNQSG